MRKGIIKGLTISIASIVLATSVTAPITTTTISTVEAAVKVVTIDGAAKKIVEATQKACEKKKKVTLTFVVNCSSKKKAEQIMDKINKAVEVIELGGYEGTSMMNLSYPRLGDFYDSPYTTKSTFKNGKLTIKLTINGKDKELREVQEQIKYGKKNLDELRSITEGMTQKQKAWRVAVWLMTDHETKYVNNGNLGKYDQSGNGDQSEKAVYNHKAGGACSQLAHMYNMYAKNVGVEGLGTVYNNNHEINCIKIDGEIYYFDMQHVDSHHCRWSNYNINYNPEGENEGWILVTDPTGKYSKVPSAAAGDMEQGVIPGYPWELSEEDYCMYPASVAKNVYKDMMKSMKKWTYEWVKYE